MVTACLLVCATDVKTQTVRAVPRPPAQAPGPPKPEDGSAAPDGYWLALSYLFTLCHRLAAGHQFVLDHGFVFHDETRNRRRKLFNIIQYNIHV
jgi:hypothetical protein